jgi:hypothetical protein
MNYEVEILNEGVIFDTFILYQFIKKLVVPFKETKAYELGIIDENGKVLKKRHTLKTSEEKAAYTVFDTFIWNIKKLLERIPFGKSKLASYAAALYFIKEQNNRKLQNDYSLLAEDFVPWMEKIQKDRVLKEYLAHHYEVMLEDVRLRNIVEDAPVNNISGGKIAGGTGADMSAHPFIPDEKKKKKKKLKKSKILRRDEKQS